MNHLDEGTIHAWLDGALDAAQSRDIEAHVAGCSICSAAVAEARGFIAGASRILGALDEVPGGVIPRGGGAAPGARVPGVTPIGEASPRRAPRQWRITRWASGIAAVLVAAIVLSTSNKAARQADFGQTSPAATERLDTTTPSMVVPGQDTTAGGAVRTSVARRPDATPVPPPSSPSPIGGREEKGEALQGRVPGAAATGKAANAPENAPAPVAQRSVAADAVVGQVAAIQPRAPEAQGFDSTRMRDSSRLRRLGDSPMRLSEVVVTGAREQAGARDQLSTATEFSRLAGCYRLDTASEAAPTAATGAAADVNASRRRAAQRAAAPSAAAPAAEFSGRGAAALVRLDTVRNASGYNVTSVGSDSTIGSWRMVGDSVRLALGARQFVMLSPSQKVRCP
jgi:hypothetical protein